MDRKTIQNALDLETNALIEEIVVFDEIDSTNLEAIRQVKQGRTGTRLYVARGQSAGRGRRGRHWLSPPGRGIYMTLAKRVQPAVESLGPQSLVTALSVLNVLKRAGARELQLKWPNDVLADNRKLAGVLLELQQTDGDRCLVYGIGINLHLTQHALAAIGQPATDLVSVMEQPPQAAAIIAGICGELLRNIEIFQAQGFQPFQAAWNANDRYCDRDVVVQAGSERKIGIARGVDSSGALQLQSAHGLESLVAGEIFPSLAVAPESP